MTQVRRASVCIEIGKVKECFHRQSQPLAHPLDGLEGRCIDAALDEAEEVHGNSNLLREPLLAKLVFEADRAETVPEILSERRHPNGCVPPNVAVISLRAPPN